LKRFLLAAGAAASLCLLPARGECAEYRVSGTYFETSACSVGCPCVYMQDATASSADFTAAWRIEKGSFGGVDLAGRTMVAVVACPDGNRAKSVGDWRGVLYIDWEANEKQRKAMESVFNERFGKSFGPNKLAVRQVPIRFEQRAGTFGVLIPGVLTARIHRVQGADGKDVIVYNAPLAFIPELHLAISDENTYEDKQGLTLGLKAFRLPQGRNGYFGLFDYSGDKTTNAERAREEARPGNGGGGRGGR
jgi:hypothetical protein